MFYSHFHLTVKYVLGLGLVNINTLFRFSAYFSYCTLAKSSLNPSFVTLYIMVYILCCIHGNITVDSFTLGYQQDLNVDTVVGPI